MALEREIRVQENLSITQNSKEPKLANFNQALQEIINKRQRQRGAFIIKRAPKYLKRALTQITRVIERTLPMQQS